MENISEIPIEKCTGCAACAQVCPANAIEMVLDHEGFFAPKLNAVSCINCGLCIQACHVKEHLKRNCIYSSKAFAAISKIKNQVKSSTSGGIFALLAGNILRQKGFVFGAAWGSEFQLRHIGISKLEELPYLQGSKYVQSSTQKALTETYQILDSGKKVLFSGTPCQVAALRTFLDDDPDNLVTIDLICHGVPSPGFFRRYICENQYIEANMYQMQFRSRRAFGLSKSEPIMSKYFSNSLTRRTPYQHDVFYTLFLSGLINRRSCFSCPYANSYRVGDFTLGDCNTAKKYKNILNTMSSSSVFINTTKAQKIWNNISESVRLTKLDIDLEIANNLRLLEPLSMPSGRDSFFTNLNSTDWTCLVREYTKPERPIDIVKDAIRPYLPEFMLKVR